MLYYISFEQIIKQWGKRRMKPLSSFWYTTIQITYFMNYFIHCPQPVSKCIILFGKTKIQTNDSVIPAKSSMIVKLAQNLPVAIPGWFK